MVVFGKKVVVLEQSGCIVEKLVYSGKVVVFGQKWFKSGKSDCIRAKVVLFGQKWLYSCKSCCIRAQLVVFGQKWF